jgi:hypothetical protein
VSEAQAALLLLLFVPLLWGLMYLGWRNRSRRQGGLAALPEAPEEVPADLLEPCEAVYVSSTVAGAPLERVVARGLGVRSAAVVTVSSTGVLIDREGAPAVWIAADRLDGVRLQRGIAGKVVDKEGLVVLTWRLGDQQLDTGLRMRHHADRDRLVAAVGALPGVAS